MILRVTAQRATKKSLVHSVLGPVFETNIRKVSNTMDWSAPPPVQKRPKSQVDRLLKGSTSNVPRSKLVVAPGSGAPTAPPSSSVRSSPSETAGAPPRSSVRSSPSEFEQQQHAAARQHPPPNDKRSPKNCSPRSPRPGAPGGPPSRLKKLVPRPGRNATLVEALSVDIDGTVADISKRIDFALQFGKDGSKEYWDVLLQGANYHTDEPILACRQSLLNWVSSHCPASGMPRRVVYVSGRRSGTESQTAAWLRQHGFPAGDIWHRPQGIRSYLWKKEALLLLNGSGVVLERKCGFGEQEVAEQQVVGGQQAWHRVKIDERVGEVVEEVVFATRDENGGSPAFSQQASSIEEPLCDGQLRIVAHIGDRVDDVDAARAAGVWGVYVWPDQWLSRSEIKEAGAESLLFVGREEVLM